MNNEEKIFNLLEKLYVELQGTKNELTDVKGNMATKDELAEIRTDMATKDELTEIRANMATKDELEKIKNVVLRIEHDHGNKLSALFDGHTLLSEKIDRIEAEVSKHEEIILRRIRQKKAPLGLTLGGQIFRS